MHFAAPSTKRILSQRKPAKTAVSHHAAEEIGAYIAVRDLLLSEAQKRLTKSALERLVLANDFVQNCLRAVTGPYLEQYLPEKDAARELKRCASVTATIAKFRARLRAA